MRPYELRRRRAAAQLLHRPRRIGAGELVRHLLAVQAQDLRSAKLALRARSQGLTAADVDAALASGELVVAWLNRGTLHLVHREDHGWLLALTAQRSNNERRLRELGVTDPDRLADTVEDALADGPLMRAELAALTGTTGQATPHVLMRAALRGRVVMCGEQRFARIDPPAPVERDAALRELGRRYLAAHAPATAEDLARWSGIALGDARRAIADPAAGHPEPVPPRLLPAFDPYLLGWRDRSFAVPAALARRVHPGGGMLRATATVDGEVVGTWSAGGIDAPDPARFDAESADVMRFLIPR